MSYFEEEEAKLFSICNVPWTFNLKRSTLDEHNLKPPCSVEYAVHQSLKLMEFFYKTSAYLLPNCRGTTSFFLYHLYRYQNSFNFLIFKPLSISFLSIILNNSEPCYTSTYHIQMTQFEKSNQIINAMAAEYRRMVNITAPNNTDTYSVVINFDTEEVDVSEHISLINLPDFVSSVGGNLGLFIGFSCLPVLLKAIQLIRNDKLLKMFWI